MRAFIKSAGTLASLMLGVSAANAAVPAQGPAPAVQGGVAADPNEMVCEKQKALGSRLAVRKVCMTRSEWARARQEDREAVEKAQTVRGVE
jgi:hypothetical protein